MRAAFNGLKAGVLAGLALAVAATLCAQSTSQSGATNAPSGAPAPPSDAGRWPKRHVAPSTGSGARA